MMNKILSILVIVFIFFGLTSFVLAVCNPEATWCPPLSTPPSPSAGFGVPLNTSSNAQLKAGPIGVNGFSLTAGGLLLNVTQALSQGGSVPTTLGPITQGMILVATSSTGDAHWMATSSLGLGSSQWITSGSNIYNGNASNVGVGTSAPTEKLDVSGNINLFSGGQLKISGARVLHNTGVSNIFVGNNSGNTSLTGISNTAVGASSLLGLTSGNQNTAVGVNASRLNAAGLSNNAFGYTALYSNINGGSNNAFGWGALYSNTGSNNVAMGHQAMYYNTTGNINTAVGSSALNNNTTGSNNTGIGSFALGGTVSPPVTGSNNTAAGVYALSLITSGANNVGLGYNAGVGTPSSNAVTSGSSNVFIGYNAAPGTATQLTNATAIGANATVSQSNSLVLGSSGVNVGIGTPTPSYALHVIGDAAKTSGGASWTVPSDARWKKNITPLNTGLETLLKLRPVKYEWRDPSAHSDETNPQMGFIAQEVEKVLPNWVKTDKDGYKYLNTSGLDAVLVKTIQEQNTEITALRTALCRHYPDEAVCQK